MNNNIFLLVALSYLIGLIFLWIIRSYDKYDKEPFGRLILFSFLGGIFSILVATFLYFFVHPKFNLTDAILKIGTVEEFSKLLTLFILYRFIRKEFDEIVDGIIYVAAISLGFSVIENIFYTLQAEFPYTLLFKRFLFATIGHISFSVYMGIAFYVHKKIHRNYLGLFLSFIMAVLAHGLYDGFLFNPRLSPLFLLLYILLIVFQFRLLKVAYAYSKMKPDFSLSNMRFVHNRTYVQCCHCQQKDTKVYHFNGIEICICQSCQKSILSKGNFKKLLKFYRPKLNHKAFIKSIELSIPKHINDKKTLVYYPVKERLNADLTDLQNWLKHGNITDLKNYHTGLEGKIFKQLGFKYLKL